MEYTRLVSTLPLPTLRQTARFAEHVATRHSWYKHLPVLPPGATFVFFLNPHAGQGIRQTAGEVTFYNIDVGDYFANSSRRSTADYLEEFGHWDFWVDNPRGAAPIDGPWLHDDSSGERILLPAGYRGRWTCQVTAFVRPGPILASRFVAERDAFVAYAERRGSDPEIERYARLVKVLPRNLSDEFVIENEAMRAFQFAESPLQKERIRGALNIAYSDCVKIRKQTAATGGQ